MTQVVEHLPSKCEALSSIPRTAKRRGKGRKERKEGGRGKKEGRR
jgi:hypothetical protein